MRVITGSARGRRLAGPRVAGIRPASDKVKEAVFNILGVLEGLRVLDLFAGSGSLGVEALSRGAEKATFVDSSFQAIQLIEKNLERCQFSKQALVLKLKLPLELGRIGQANIPYDIVFVDPPYDHRLVNATLRRLVREKILAPSGIVVVEHSPREKITSDVGLTLVDERKYGQTLITFLKT